MMDINDNCALITKEYELEEILQATEKVLVLVYATWCPFCVRFLATFKKYARNNPFFLLAQDNDEHIADKYNIEVVPTVIFFEGGAVSKRLDGVLGVGLNERQLTEFINKCNLPAS